MSGEVITGVFGLIAAGLSSTITYYATRTQTKKEYVKSKESYIDDRLKEIIEIYQKEVKQLREEVQKLTRENVHLRDEIMGLKNTILHGVECKVEGHSIEVVTKEPVKKKRAPKK